MVVRTHFDSQAGMEKELAWGSKRACALSSLKPKRSSPASLLKRADTMAPDGRRSVPNPEAELVEPLRRLGTAAQVAC